MARILCTVTNDLTYDQRMIRICTSLQEDGHEVLLIGRKRPDSIPLRQEIFQQKRLPCFFEKGKLFYLEYNLRLVFFLLARPFDIACAVDLDTILPAFWISRLKGKICVYDAHEYFTEVPEVVRRPAVKRVWERVARHTISRLRYAYTVGPELAEIFESRYGTPFELIRNLPWKREQAPAETHHSPPVLLYQGALNEGRGLEFAIEAMQQAEGAELWLAGEGDLSEQLRRQCRELGLEEKVKFLGFIPPHELRELTPQAYIGLNLLENKGLSYYYSLANKAFDYIQAGVPSIHMAFPEYVRLNQQYEVFLLLEELSTDTLAASLRALLENEALHKRLQDNCALAAEELNWEREEIKLKAFYRAIS